MGIFIKNTARTLATDIVGVILTLISSVIIARVLGPQGKGFYTIALLLPYFVISLTSAGIMQATIYYTAHKDFPAKEIFGNSLIISFFISTITVLIGFVIVHFFSKQIMPNVPLKYLYWALAIIPLGILCISLRNIILGLQLVAYFNFFIFSENVLRFVLTILFILVFGFGVTGCIIAVIATLFIMSVIIVWKLFRILGGISLKPTPAYFKKILSYGALSHASSVLDLLNYRIDYFLINGFLSPSAVGLYSCSVAIVEKLWMICAASSLVLFPRIAAETNEDKRKEVTPLVCRTIFFITAVGAAIIYFISHWIVVTLFSVKFLPAVEPLRILIFGVVALTVWRILSHDLLGRGYPQLNIYVNIPTVIVNIVLNILWIPAMGIAGAALASVVSYSIASLGVLITYCKITGIPVYQVILPQPTDWNLYYRLFKDALRGR